MLSTGAGIDLLCAIWLLSGTTYNYEIQFYKRIIYNSCHRGIGTGYLPAAVFFPQKMGKNKKAVHTF